MKRGILSLILAMVLSGFGGFFLTAFAVAEPIEARNTFHFRDHRSPNTVGMTAGDRLTFGAHWVVPNGDGATTGIAQQLNYYYSPPKWIPEIPLKLNFNPYSTGPNQFDASFPYYVSMTGQWVLTFTNQGNTTVVHTPPVGDAPKLPFAASVAMGGSSLTPTFSWTFPGDYTPDGIRIQIWDLENRLPSGIADNIHLVTLPGDAAAYTVPSTLSTGKKLEPGHLYSLEVTFALTRNDSSGNKLPLGNNTTLLSRSRSLFNFVPGPRDSPADVSAFLPMVTPGPEPVFTFNAPVAEGQLIFTHTEAAGGYEYKTGGGNPNFASVLPPAGKGNKWYDLYLFNGTDPFFKARIKGGVPYKFASGGVNRFLILGPAKSAGLDPDNPAPFITGLAFAGSGQFTGTMEPVSDDFEPKVTGGGWIPSPPGAYKANEYLEGRANFGFVSKYPKDAAGPEGETQFVFAGGHLRFHGDGYEWLEVNPARTSAQFVGTGALNGQEGYGFMIWAKDQSEDGGADTFRIRIWEVQTGTLIYDSGAEQELGGGSIVIHKK